MARMWLARQFANTLDAKKSARPIIRTHRLVIESLENSWGLCLTDGAVMRQNAPLRLPVLVNAEPHVYANDRMLPPHSLLLAIYKFAERIGWTVQVVCTLRPPPKQVWSLPTQHLYCL